MTEIKKYNIRLVQEEGPGYKLDEEIVKNPENAAEIFCRVLELDARPQETMAMLTLDTKNNVTGIMTVTIGVLDSTLVHPRDIYQRAILQNAAGIILAHNHTSQDTEPSEDDIKMTNRLVEAGEIIGIELYDHIIIGNGYLSMRERGII